MAAPAPVAPGAHLRLDAIGDAVPAAFLLAASCDRLAWWR